MSSILHSLAERGGRWLCHAGEGRFLAKFNGNWPRQQIQRWRLDSLCNYWFVWNLRKSLRLDFFLHLKEAGVGALELVLDLRLTCANHARDLLL